MKRKLQIAVIGSDGDICSKKAYRIAYETGKEIAKADCILLSGGMFGVMEAVCKGAVETGGLVVGLLPWDDKYHGNKYAQVIIPTGFGFARSQALINAADGVIAIEGGVGTLGELCQAYYLHKPTVAIANSGGIARKSANQRLDRRKHEPIVGVKTPAEAVAYVIKHARIRHSDPAKWKRSV